MSDESHFERLGLPRRFRLEPAELEREYLARSRALHPDHHADAGGAALASTDLSSRLNQAYTVLRDPFKRADYLLTLLGGPTASDQKQMPAEFLEEMLTLRMEIEEAKGNPVASAALEKQLEERRAKMLDPIAPGFEKAGDAASLAKLRQQLNAVKYVQNLLRDLREA